MIEIIMERFGSIRQKTIHDEKILLDDGLHFKCQYLNCPTNDGHGICKSIILNDSMRVKYCFCG